MSRFRLASLMLSALFGGLAFLAPLGFAQPFNPGDPGIGFEPSSQERLAGLVVVSGFTGPLSGYVAGAGLVAGTDPTLRIWEIDPLVLHPRIKIPHGASQAFLAGVGGVSTGAVPSGINVLAVLRLGDEYDFWTIRDTTRIERIEPAYLEQVQDNKGIGSWADGNIDVEHQAYFAMLIAAHRTPQATMEQSALKNITYAHLLSEPKKYRGEMIELTGNLRRIRRFDPPMMARENGVPNLYEGWIFYEPLGPDPFCVVFSELPPGVKVAEKMNVPVRFVGYSFKRYRYTPAAQPPGKAPVQRNAPLLIGKTVVPIDAIENRGGFGEKLSESLEATNLVSLIVSGIVVLAVIGFIMTLMFRRSDAAVAKRLRDARQREFVRPEEPNPAERN